MKIKKIFLTLIITLFITGCNNVSYNLNINLNSIEEHLYFNYNNVENIEELLKDNIDNNPNFDHGNVRYKFDNFSVDIFYTIDDIKKSKVYYMLYNKINTTKENNITNVILSDYNTALFECTNDYEDYEDFEDYEDYENYEDYIDCGESLDMVTLNLTSEYKIISSNADEVDEKSNTHTWYFTKEVRPNLTFSYSDDIRWDIVIKNFMSKNLTSIIIGIVLIISVITGIYFIYKTIKNS